MRPYRLLLLGCMSGCGFHAASSHGDAAVVTGDSSNAGAPDAPCADDDKDTICNAVDQCPGMDDRIDIDHDGIPDCKDDWLCGATKPSAPSDPLVHIGLTDQWSADHQDLDSSGRVVTVHAGAAIKIKLNWDIRVSCAQQPSCLAQLELGFDQSVGRDRCVFDGTVTNDQIKSGTVDDSVTLAPTPAGASQAYDLRLNIGRRTSCGTSGWYGGEPGSSSTIAKLCVIK